MLPGGLLLVEYLFISLLVDLPLGGPAMGMVGAVRLAAPVVLAAAAAGWLLARRGPRAQPVAGHGLPPWRPWPALALQPVAFAGTALLAWRLLGPEAPPVDAAGLAAWLACAAATALLALRIAVPLRWAARRLASGWLVPVLALGLGAAAWRAAAEAEKLWGLLSAGTLEAVGAVLRLGPGQVTMDRAELLIGLDGFEVLVAPICSGVDGAGLVAVFLATWIALARERLRGRRALLLLPLGVAAALAANVLRIAALLWVGASGHEALALGGFHSKLGWLLFLALALGGVALAERWPWLRREAATPAEADHGVPRVAGAYLGPLLVALGAALLTGIWAAGPFDPWYAARVVAGGAVLLAVRRSLPAPQLDLAGAWAPALLGAAVAAGWMALSQGDGAALAGALSALGPAERAAWVGARLLGAVVVIPVVEELAFRGFLLPWLVSPDLEAVGPRAWTPAALLLSSAAFGFLHPQWLLGALAGLAFAAARLWRGRLGDAVLAHAACNAVLAAAALGAGRLDLWS